MVRAKILDEGLAEYVSQIRITEPQVASHATFKSHMFSRNGACRQRVGRNCRRESRQGYRASKQLPKTRENRGEGGETEMTEIATFGAGCFWGVEPKFRMIPGVVDAAVGYSNGHTANPTYKDVCTDETGHAEAVQVIFDPEKVSYEKLLEGFWLMHDPTQVNRQGPDFGKQYRSAIFFHSPEQ